MYQPQNSWEYMNFTAQNPGLRTEEIAIGGILNDRCQFWNYGTSLEDKRFDTLVRIIKDSWDKMFHWLRNLRRYFSE